MDKDIDIHFGDIYNPIVKDDVIIITENEIKNKQTQNSNKIFLDKSISTNNVDPFFCNILFSICCCCFFLSE